MQSNQLVIATTTVATQQQAQAIARALVADQLAACVQVDGPITSYYAWEGKLEESSEWRLTIKTLSDREAAAASRVLAMHPYELPQWVVTVGPVASPGYLNWVRASVQSNPST